MHWKSKSWILISLLLAAFTARAQNPSQIATTTVADTINHADGTAATGTALISWPAFTTSNGDAIPAGSTSATIASGGALSVQLIPNAGATPIGTYYTVVYHLDDGTISRQYWVVPAASAPVKISAIESTVLPTSVAMQTVSKAYVDTAIAVATSGHPLDSTPYVLKSGDTLTGPLTLPADPVSATQAADKHYVDSSVAAVSGGLGQMVSVAGDIGGTASAPMVTGIQGRPVSAAAPSAGQALVWNGSAYAPSTPADDVDLSSPPAIGNATGAPSLNVSANNYPATGWDSYTAVNFNCAQTLLPADNGSSYPGGFCLNTTYQDWAPGNDYGSPGTLSDGGWALPYGFGLHVDSKSAGIRVAQQVEAQYTGPGDTVVLNLNANSKEAVISGSTEGLHVVRENLQELPFYTGTIAGGGAGATALQLNVTANGSSLGLNSPLIDTASATSCTVTPTGNGTGSWGTVATATTSCTLPVSDAGTLAANVDVPRLAPNTTGQLSKSTQTVTLNTTADLSTLPAPIVCSIMGPAFYETIGNDGSVPIAFGTYNSTAHTQTVTANFHYSHMSGTQFYCGGAAGLYFEQTSYATGYLMRIYGSTAANTILFGHETAAGFVADYAFGGPGNIYKGGDVVGVLNPSTGQPDGAYAAIEPNTAAWANGDAVENTNNISANYFNDYLNSVINNPYAQHTMHQDNWFGAGGALSYANGDIDFTGGTAGNYKGLAAGSHLYNAPSWATLHNNLSTFITSDYAPLAYAGAPVGMSGWNCYGFMFCIAHGPAPGAASTVEGIFAEGDDGSSLTYDHATGIFNFTSRNGGGPGVAINGTLLAPPRSAPQGGIPYYSAGGIASALSADNNASTDGGGNWKLTSLYTNLITPNGPSCGDCNNVVISASQTRPLDASSAYIQMWGYCGGSNCGNLPAGQIYLHGFDATNGLVIDNSNSNQAYLGGAGFGYAAGTALPAGFSTGPNQPLSVGCTSTTSCAASFDPATGGYVGPATAPTGACSRNGEWVFSQDGHATFCASGAWVTKI